MAAVQDIYSETDEFSHVLNALQLACLSAKCLDN